MGVLVTIIPPAAVFALEIEEPELLWRQVLGGAALTRPAPQLKSVVIVCEGAAVKAFSGSGGFLWEYRAGGRLLPFITRAGDGASYVCRTNGIFLALNRAGRRRWQINLREGITFAPLTGWDGRIFVFLPKKVLCFTASGTQLWRLELGAEAAGAPVPDKSGGFAAVLDNGSFLRVNAFGEMSVQPLSSMPAAVIPLPPSPAWSGDVRFAALYADGGLGIVGWREAGSGMEERLPVRLPGRPVAAAERGGSIAVLLANGNLALVSPERGVLWVIKTLFGGGAETGGDVTVEWNERGIYLLSRDGGEAYNMAGERLWNMRLTGSAAAPVLDEDGVLYAGGKDWIFYAYRVEERGGQGAGVYSIEAGGSYGLMPSEVEAGCAGNPVQTAFLLEAAEDCVRYGRLGRKEPEYTGLLLKIAEGGDNDLTQRLRALRLLGFIGSRETVPFLAGLFRREQNTFVKSASAEAIGAIGVDPEGLALSAFAEAIAAPASRLQERLLSSIAAATGRLCRFSGPPLSERGVPLLVNLAGPSQPKSVRRRAGAELAALYKN